jgi:predicted transcriptional regulator
MNRYYDNNNEKRINSVELMRVKYTPSVNFVRKQLIKYRKTSGLNQSEFAFRMDMAQNYISRVESGNVDFTLEVFFALIDIYKLNPLWLLFGVEPAVKKITQTKRC